MGMGNVDRRHSREVATSNWARRFCLALLAAGCSSGSSSGSSGGTNWSTVTTASAGGGMTKLIAAAKEGTLNVIALPPTWANYGTIIKAFTAQYGIKVSSSIRTSPASRRSTRSSRKRGTGRGLTSSTSARPVAQANTSLFAPYQVATWRSIPAGQKATMRPGYEDYGGYMSVGYSSKFGTITSLNQLLTSRFKNAVALNGNPTSANAALNGVMMANLAEGGTADNISKGVAFFHRLKTVGNFSPVSATGASIKAGTTPVVFNWDYLNLPSYVGVPNWKVFVPANAVLGGYYAQAINKSAPHPAAARLWEEFLYSQGTGDGQNLWLQGGARPVEEAAMTSNGSIDKTAAAALPPVNGTPVFLTQTQNTDTAHYLAANWAKAIG